MSSISSTQTFFTDRLLYVPSSASNLPALLTGQGWSQREIYDHQDKVAYVLNRILTAPVTDARLKHGDYVSINFNVLANVIGARYVKWVLATLTNADVIECDGLQSQTGHKSYGYRITEKAKSIAVGLMIFKQETFGKKLFEYSQRQHMELRKNRFLNRILKEMTHLRIHYDQARAYNKAVLTQTQEFIITHRSALLVGKMSKEAYGLLLDEATSTDARITLPSRKEIRNVMKSRSKRNPDVTYYAVAMDAAVDAFSANLIAIEKLHNQEFQIPTRPVHGSRVYTSLTNLASWIRKYLYHEKYPLVALVNIDIKNSQPFLLCLLLNKKYNGIQLPPDVVRYMELTATGQFYEFAAEAMGIQMVTKRERREFKSKFFGSIFFCKNLHTEGSRFGQWFIREFPNVYELISDYKRHDYKNLAVAMQTAEAGVIIDTVVKKLHQRKIWNCSIHDSIVCLRGDAYDVKDIILEAFQSNVAILPSLDEELLNK